MLLPTDLCEKGALFDSSPSKPIQSRGKSEWRIKHDPSFSTY